MILFLLVRISHEKKFFNILNPKLKERMGKTSFSHRVPTLSNPKSNRIQSNPLLTENVEMNKYMMIIFL